MNSATATFFEFLAGLAENTPAGELSRDMRADPDLPSECRHDDGALLRYLTRRADADALGQAWARLQNVRRAVRS